MTLSASFKTARDLLAKLDRDYTLLNEGISSDRFFNFVVTAYSLSDWVKNDPSDSAAAKAGGAGEGITKVGWRADPVASRGNGHFRAVF